MYKCISVFFNVLIKQSRVLRFNFPCCVVLNLFFLNCLGFEKKLGQLCHAIYKPRERERERERERGIVLVINNLCFFAEKERSKDKERTTYAKGKNFKRFFIYNCM